MTNEQKEKEVAFMKNGELHITQEGRQAMYQGIGNKWASNIMDKIVNGNPALSTKKKEKEF